MKVGIMGGTFDPIHLGHLIAAERAGDELGLDEVRFMPTNAPPHKPNPPKASAEERLHMVRLAVAGHPYFRASDAELKRGGTSYTIDTVSALCAGKPVIDLHYIIGADMVMYLPKWYRIEELSRLVTFVGLQRPGYNLRLESLPAFIRDRIKLIEMPAIGISSTAVRRMRAAGHSIRFLVPEAVEAYIKEKRLYER